MATILQRGNKVTARSDGTRTSVPRSEEEAERATAAAKRRGPPPIGGINRRNKEAMDAAGMKRGGKVKARGK